MFYQLNYGPLRRHRSGPNGSHEPDTGQLSSAPKRLGRTRGNDTPTAIDDQDPVADGSIPLGRAIDHMAFARLTGIADECHAVKRKHFAHC